MSKYLFIGSHPDDLELCCGGTIVKLVQYGHNVHITAMSSYIGINDDLIHEYTASAKLMGVSIMRVSSFRPRNFLFDRTEILHQLHGYLLDGYDYIFTHSANDIHQDHKVIGEESLRAFKKLNLVTYQAEWNSLTYESNYFVELTEENMAKKLEAMACYKSQQHRPYFDKTFTYSRALLAGAKIGVKYAEPFRIVNMHG